MLHSHLIPRPASGSPLPRPLLFAVAGLVTLLASACNTHSGSASRLTTAELVAPPQGIFEFCVQRLEDCGVTTPEAKDADLAKVEETEAAPLSDAQVIEAAVRVNHAVNSALSYRSDLEQWGREEAWLLPLSEEGVAYGDCEDYALEKRRELLRLGVSEDRLSLATAWSEDTGLHAVLIVRTAQADYVLDNATPIIMTVGATDYRWLSLQTGPHLLSWARVETQTMPIQPEEILTAG